MTRSNSERESVVSVARALGAPHPSAGRLTVAAAFAPVVAASLALALFASSQVQQKGSETASAKKQSGPALGSQKAPQNGVLPPKEKNLPARRDEPQGWDAWRESRKTMSGFFERELYRLGRDMEASNGTRESAPAPSPAPSSSEVQGTGKPATVPVTKGYKNWQLGMPRSELLSLVELWKSLMPDVAKNQPLLAHVNYIKVTFDDGEEVKFAVGKADPPRTTGSPAARVIRIEVGYGLMQLDVANRRISFLEMLDKDLGEPTTGQITTRGTIGRPPMTQSDRAFLAQLSNVSEDDFFYYARGTKSIFTAVTKLQWCWPTEDVDATCTLEVYPNERYAAWLEFDQGLRARGRTRQAAETAAARKQREAEEAALRGFRESIPPKRRSN